MYTFIHNYIITRWIALPSILFIDTLGQIEMSKTKYFRRDNSILPFNPCHIITFYEQKSNNRSHYHNYHIKETSEN